MPFCAVLVQISQELVKNYSGARFLLQVWDDKNKKVYERALQSKLQDFLNISCSWGNNLGHKLQVPDVQARGTRWKQRLFPYS